MVELKGSLNGIGLPAIVQLIGELHHSGSLELSKGSTRGVLDFDDGRLVAADFGEETGFKALATLSLELADGEFTFVEHAPLHERTLDLGSKDVQVYLRRVASGEDIAVAAEPPAIEPNGLPSLGTCPLLGFADDRERHYSRATALHRCFATGAPSLVTGQEQRELCLSGRYPTCPRYRNQSTAIETTPDEVVVAPTMGPEVASDPVAQVPPPIEAAPPPPIEPSPPPPIEAAPPQAMPSGVAARMAVANNNMHLADAPSHDATDGNNAGLHTRNGPDRTEPATPTVVRQAPVPSGVRGARRAMVLVGSGVLIGLILLAAILLVSLPSMNGSLTTQKPSVAGAQSSAPTVARAPVIATSVPAAPITAPAPSAVARPISPTAAPRPTAFVAPAGPSLLDVRFAAGAGDRWLDNPPFAGWNDGAFRLKANQAARFVAIAAPVDQLLSDVVVSATFRKTGGPPGGGYGLIVRDQGPDPRDGVNQLMNAYVFEAGDLGEFGIWRRDGDHWVDLVPWMRSVAVRPGGSPNDLVVRAVGETMTFSVNGTQVASVQDDTLLAGGVGVFVGGDYNEVALDRFTVQVPN